MVVATSTDAGAEGEVPRTEQVVVAEEEETGERVAMMCCSCVGIVSCEEKKYLLTVIVAVSVVKEEVPRDGSQTCTRGSEKVLR